jgi:hypothetical protein
MESKKEMEGGGVEVSSSRIPTRLVRVLCVRHIVFSSASAVSAHDPIIA